MDSLKTLFEYFVDKVGDKCTVKKFNRKANIFSEAHSQDYVYIVKSGQVEINKITLNWDDRILFLLSEGYVLNEEILFSDNSNCATNCIAFTKVELYCITKQQLLKEMRDDFLISQYIFKNSNIKLTRMYRQIKNAGSNITLEKKIVSKLWKLSLDYGKETEKGILIDMAVTSSVIAKMVGAKRESVSRKLSDLKKENIIEIDYDSIIILDSEKLSEKMK